MISVDDRIHVLFDSILLTLQVFLRLISALPPYEANFVILSYRVVKRKIMMVMKVKVINLV